MNHLLKGRLHVNQQPWGTGAPPALQSRTPAPCSHAVSMRCSRASHAQCFHAFAGGWRTARSRGVQPAVALARRRRASRPEEPAESAGRKAAAPAGNSKATSEDSVVETGLFLLSALPFGLFSAWSYERGDTVNGVLAAANALFIILCATTLLTLVALAAAYDWWASTRR